MVIGDDGTPRLHTSRFVRRAQRVWRATQASYQGAGNYRSRVAHAGSNHCTSDTLAGARHDWRKGVLDMLADVPSGAVNTVHGAVEIVDDGNKVVESCEKATKAMNKASQKRGDKLLEEHAAGRLVYEERQKAVRVQTMLGRKAVKHVAVEDNHAVNSNSCSENLDLTRVYFEFGKSLVESDKLLKWEEVMKVYAN